MAHTRRALPCSHAQSPSCRSLWAPIAAMHLGRDRPLVAADHFLAPLWAQVKWWTKSCTHHRRPTWRPYWSASWPATGRCMDQIDDPPGPPACASLGPSPVCRAIHLADLLDQAGPPQVAQLQAGTAALLQQHSRALRHDFAAGWLLLVRRHRLAHQPAGRRRRTGLLQRPAQHLGPPTGALGRPNLSRDLSLVPVSRQYAALPHPGGRTAGLGPPPPLTRQAPAHHPAQRWRCGFRHQHELAAARRTITSLAKNRPAARQPAAWPRTLGCMIPKQNAGSHQHPTRPLCAAHPHVGRALVTQHGYGYATLLQRTRSATLGHLAPL